MQSLLFVGGMLPSGRVHCAIVTVAVGQTWMEVLPSSTSALHPHPAVVAAVASMVAVPLLVAVPPSAGESSIFATAVCAFCMRG